MSDELKTYYVVGKQSTPKPNPRSARQLREAEEDRTGSSTHVKYESVEEARESCQQKLRSMPRSGPWIVYRAIESIDVPVPDIEVRKMHA
jgi:hypothetical protein